MEKNNTITPSLGYIFSDEGSGYDLGRRLLNMFFNDKLNPNINSDIRNHAKTPKNELLNKIYKLENPKKFISTFSFVVKKNEKNALIDDLIKNHLFPFYIITHLNIQILEDINLVSLVVLLLISENN